MTKNKENISQYPNSIDTRVALLEMSISHINETLIRIEKRFDKIDERFDKVDNKIDSNFKWTLGLLVIPFYGSIISLILGKILHWF